MVLYVRTKTQILHCLAASKEGVEVTLPLSKKGYNFENTISSV
jgi:hypothetical protein